MHVTVERRHLWPGLPVGICNAKFQKFGSLQVVWRDKMLFDMYIIVWHAFGLLVVLAVKKLFGIF